MHFQPIVELTTGRLLKAEALLRWNHPVRGWVSPGTFIPLAEESRLINELGDFAFHQSVHWAKRWRELLPPGVQLSVNMSPIQFQSEGCISSWLRYLEGEGLQGSQICLEITEGLLLHATPRLTAKLNSLRDAGVQVSIDDFGTGYSSLAYLKKFDIDYLKIDQSFVRNLGKAESDLALCEAIVVMAHKLGLAVIAEGVETELQMNLLGQIGCDFGQGYLFARPMPGEMFENWLREVQRQNFSDK